MLIIDPILETYKKNPEFLEQVCLQLAKIDPLGWHELMPMQAKFAEDPAKFKAIFGGNRSGKSEGVAAYVLRKCLTVPRQKWWIAGETFQDSIAVQQSKIWRLCPRHEIKYGKYSEINGFTNRKLLLKNGSLIIFKSFDQSREQYQGDAIDGFWGDEELPYDIYQEARMRLLDRNGEMVLSMTSLKGITELIEEVFDGYDTIESQFAPMVDEVLPRIAEKDGKRFYLLWTEENPHIDQGRVREDAATMPLAERRSRLYGVPTNLAGKIYPTFNRHIHVCRGLDDMPEGRYTLYNVLDPHDRKPWAIGWYAVHQTGTAWMIDEYPNRNFNDMLYDDKTYDDYAALIKDKEDKFEEVFNAPVARRIIDPNFGNKTIQLAERQGGQSRTTPREELRKRGLNYRDGIDALEAGHLKVREWLHWAGKAGEIIVQPKIFILEHCQNTIRHMSRYSRKDTAGPDGDVRDSVKPMDKYKDFPDLVRYFLMDNPVYRAARVKEPEFRKAY